MRKHYSFGYMISQSLKSLVRNSMMTLASIAVLMACLTLMGCFGLLVYNIDENMAQLGSLNQVVAYCSSDVSEQELKEVERQIKLQSVVNTDSVTVQTKDEVYLEQKQKLYDSYEGFYDKTDSDLENNNPYPHVVHFTFKEGASIEAISRLEADLRLIEIEQLDENGEPMYDENGVVLTSKAIEKVRCEAELAQKIENLKTGITWIFTGFLAVLFVVSVFVIINTIKLAVFSRRQEITIMRYVGATKGFITTPFVMEGVFIGLLSSAVSYGVVYAGYRVISNMIGTKYQLLTIVPFAEIQWHVLAAFAVIGVVTGIIGSSISLSKYLKA